MCGRFALYAPTELIRKHYKLTEEYSLQPRYNIGPGQEIDVIRRTPYSGQYELVPMLWGLIPFWAKERKIGYKMINARAETIEEKAFFKKSFQQCRCLIPANGFYEWKKREARNKKQPYFIQRQDDDIFSFAGLWSRWTDKANGDIVESCVIITTSPNSMLARIHNRMPVILPSVKYNDWMDPNSGVSVLKSILCPLAAEILQAYPVSDLCNNVKNDTSECIEQVGANICSG
jgi:putative SOS response-associated peptidase YedK